MITNWNKVKVVEVILVLVVVSNEFIVILIGVNVMSDKVNDDDDDSCDDEDKVGDIHWAVTMSWVVFDSFIPE